MICSFIAVDCSSGALSERGEKLSKFNLCFPLFCSVSRCGELRRQIVVETIIWFCCSAGTNLHWLTADTKLVITIHRTVADGPCTPFHQQNEFQFVFLAKILMSILKLTKVLDTKTPKNSFWIWQAINCKIIYLSIHVFAKRGEIAENCDQFWSVLTFDVFPRES